MKFAKWRPSSGCSGGSDLVCCCFLLKEATGPRISIILMGRTSIFADQAWLGVVGRKAKFHLCSAQFSMCTQLG